MFNGSFKSLICWRLIPKTDLLAPWGPLWIMSFALSVGWSTSSYTVIITHLGEREKEREVWSRYICQVCHKDAFLCTPSQRCKWADWGEKLKMASVLGTQADKNRGGEYCWRLQAISSTFISDPYMIFEFTAVYSFAHTTQELFACRPLRGTAVNEINQ